MDIKKLIKETKYLNTIVIFKNRSKFNLIKYFNNLFFLIKYIFFKKKIEYNLNKSYSEKIFKTKQGRSIKMHVNVNQKIDYSSYFIYPHNKKIKDILPNIKFIFDVGANIGAWALAKRLYFNQDVKIYCYEPSKITCEYLKKNLLREKNIQIYNCALGDKNCYETLSLPVEEMQGGRQYYSALNTLKTKSLFFREKVQVFKFDFLYERDLKKIIDPHNTEIFIKVDVEGYELEFLNGAYQTLKALNKVLIEIEFNKKIFFYSKEDYLSNFKKRLSLLKKMGFKKVFYNLWDELLPKDSNNELQLINIDDLDVKKIFERKELDKTNQYKNVNASNIFFLK